MYADIRIFSSGFLYMLLLLFWVSAVDGMELAENAQMEVWLLLWLWPKWIIVPKCGSQSGSGSGLIKAKGRNGTTLNDCGKGKGRTGVLYCLVFCTQPPQIQCPCNCSVYCLLRAIIKLSGASSWRWSSWCWNHHPVSDWNGQLFMEIFVPERFYWLFCQI